MPAKVAQVPRKENPFLGAHIDNVGITIGAEGSNTINVALQLRDANWNDLTECGHIVAYLSDNADGSTITGTVPTSTVAIGTDGLIIPLVTDKVFLLVSEADGDIDINIIQTAGQTYYLVLCLPDGRIQVSDAIVFAA